MENSINSFTGHRMVRKVLSVSLMLLMVITVIFNAFAGIGMAPFVHPTGNVSHMYETCFTPASYAFSIWSVIYIFLVFIVIYAQINLFRTGHSEADALAFSSVGGAISNPFLLSFIINLLTNIGWLFVWDALNLTGSAILLILVAVTNLLAMLFALRAFNRTSTLMWDVYRKDYIANVLVINGYGMYATWTVVAAHLNASIFYIHQLKLDADTVCLVNLYLIVFWFTVVEVVPLLYRFTAPLVTHDYVYLWASVAILVKNGDSVSTAVYWAIVVNIIMACLWIVKRMVYIAIKMYKKRSNDLVQIQGSKMTKKTQESKKLN